MDGIYSVGLGLDWAGIMNGGKCLDGIDGVNFHGFSGKPQLRGQAPSSINANFHGFLCSEV